MYEKGLGGELNLERAKDLYRQASDLRDHCAMYRLSLLDEDKDNKGDDRKDNDTKDSDSEFGGF